jgi:ParB/RepB/Spo0J family partition protein
VTKRKGSLSTVVDFMSDDAQVELRERAGILSPLPLVAILPDPNQPRQLLPSDLAEQVQSGRLSPLDAVGEWQKRGRAKTADPALRRDIEELERLANSIAQHGLINPISVRRAPGNANVPDGVKYLIITGERRYWAHTLLAAAGRTIQEGLETVDPHTIKATIAPEGISIRAHQIVENVMREDIDAIEKAQGFLALRYELSGQDVGPEPGGAEGRNHGSGLVSWTQVDQALNISDRYRRYVTAVLKLDPRAQEIIKRNRLSERTIRPISQKLSGQPELQLEALGKLLAWQEADAPEEGAITKAVDALVAGILAREERRQTRPAADVAPLPKQELHAAQLRSKVEATLRFLETLGEEGRAGLAQELHAKEAYVRMIEEIQKLKAALAEILSEVVMNDTYEES